MQKLKPGIIFAMSMAVIGIGNAATLSYQGAATFSYTDPTCTTSFSMDANGKVSCSGVPTTPVTPSCSITPANPTFAQNGSGLTLTANCINNPTSFEWKLDGVPVSSTASYAPPASLTPKSYAVALAATNAAGTGTATATLVVTAPVTPPPPTSCAQSITEVAMDFTGPAARWHTKMNRGQAYAYSFTTDSVGRSSSFETAESTIGSTVFRFLNLSEQKCDFSYDNYDSHNGCATSGEAGATIYFTFGQPQFMYCQLKPNTTYYVNIRNENPSLGDARHPSVRGLDSCGVGQTCGYVFVMH